VDPARLAREAGLVTTAVAPEAGREAPVPAGGSLPHVAALDGIRGVAVIGVLLFHGGVGWARGGWLGVSVFFTMSGFLITSLLLHEWAASGTISLRRFWDRRARRLLPAALLCLAGIATYAWAFASPADLANLRGDLLAALGYAANWRFLLRDLSYGDLFSNPSPLQHFWSLAIEEQFYVVYPLLVLAALRLGGRRALTAVLVVAGVGSVAWGLSLDQIDRVYYGTDTRLAELVAGGLLALWVTRGPASGPVVGRRVVTALGLLASAGTLGLWAVVEETSPWVTGGVLAVQALLSVLLLRAATVQGPVARLLAVRPLVAAGTVSYGLYLFHWPLFLVLDEDRLGFGGVGLLAVRIAATTAVAVASYRVVEHPIRRRRVLVRPRVALGALAGGVSLVVAVSLVATASPGPTIVAHADVQEEDQVIKVTKGREPAPTSDAPASVFIIGDSGTYDLAPALSAMYRHLGTGTMVDASWPGFGLTREVFPWRDDWPGIVAQQAPELVIALFGGWDRGFVDERGVAAYDEVVDEAVDILTAGGARVLWLSMLPDGKTDTAVMDARYRAAARRHPDTVRFADVGPVLAGPDGDVPRWLPGEDGSLELARKPDGWHLCPDGAARLATAIGREAARLGLAPAPTDGWQAGTWRAERRYDDPPGGCDPEAPGNRPGG
jgi:peptidoglycan/LPS O-acetylase OafA/YrhL